MNLLRELLLDLTRSFAVFAGMVALSAACALAALILIGIFTMVARWFIEAL